MNLDTLLALDDADKQAFALLELDSDTRKDLLVDIKAKSKPLFLKLSGKVQSQKNIASKDKEKGELTISIHAIKPHPYQPRKTVTEEEVIDRKESIRERKLLQPISLHKSGDDYFLVAGQVRLAAYKALEAEDKDNGVENSEYSLIKYTLREKSNYSSLDYKLDALTENLSRNKMTVIDTAFAVIDAYEEALKADNKLSVRKFASMSGLGSAGQISKYQKIVEQDSDFINYINEKGFDKLNIIYQVAKEDITVANKKELIDNAIAGNVKTSDLEKKNHKPKKSIAQKENNSSNNKGLEEGAKTQNSNNTTYGREYLELQEIVSKLPSASKNDLKVLLQNIQDITNQIQKMI